MEYRPFGSTGMTLSVMGLGGLPAHYEGVRGHPPPEEKRRIYLRAEELGVSLFDMGAALFGRRSDGPDGA